MIKKIKKQIQTHKSPRYENKSAANNNCRVQSITYICSFLYQNIEHLVGGRFYRAHLTRNRNVNDQTTTTIAAIVEL